MKLKSKIKKKRKMSKSLKNYKKLVILLKFQFQSCLKG